MSEPRDWAQKFWDAQAKVDRLTEALEAAERERDEWQVKYAEREQRWHWNLIRESSAIGARQRAEADLADEKRRHGELRAGLEALADEYGCGCLLDGRPCWGCRLRATTEPQQTPRVGTEGAGTL